MSKLFWNMFGIQITQNGKGEIEYKTKCRLSDFQKDVITFEYGFLIIITSTLLLTINIEAQSIFGFFGAITYIISSLTLFQIMLRIFDNYYVTYNPLFRT